MANYDESKWKNITPDNDWGLGDVWNRFNLLASDDPFIGFFTQKTVNSINNVLTRAVGSEDLKRVIVNDVGALQAVAIAAINKSPLAMLLTSDFKMYIVSLLVRATFPEDAR